MNRCAAIPKIGLRAQVVHFFVLSCAIKIHSCSGLTTLMACVVPACMTSYVRGTQMLLCLYQIISLSTTVNGTIEVWSYPLISTLFRSHLSANSADCMIQCGWHFQQQHVEHWLERLCCWHQHLDAFNRWQSRVTLCFRFHHAHCHIARCQIWTWRK